MANSILVVGEVADGALVPITAEMLGAARRLGAGSVACVLIGSGVEANAKDAIAFGADEALVVDSGDFAAYNPDAYLQALLHVVESASGGSPAIILFGQTNLGRDLAPRLAFRLNTGVIMDTVELALAGDRLQGTRPAYGGNARAVNVVRADPQIATVRAKSQNALERDDARSGATTKVDITIDASAVRIKVTERKGMPAEGVRLEDADVVVTGGRGMGGAVGASRAVCDLGWRPVSEQIGLTGKVVSPTLYIAVGVSGASQHMAGCSGAKNIVAINKDPDANIFKSSRFGIVDDFSKVMKPLIEAAKSEKAS